MNYRERQDTLAKALLKPINTAAIVLLGVYTVVWGLWVVNPFWEVFNSAKLFSALVAFAPPFIPAEYLWGTIAICCGLVTIRGAIKRSYRALTVGAGTAGWHWFMIGIFYLAGDWHNTGGVTALAFAIYSVFIYLNIKVNYKKNHQLPTPTMGDL